jgi:adenylate cyclase
MSKPIDDIVNWLADGARSAATSEQVLTEICERLVKIGMPLWRVGVFVRSLHPDIYGRGFVWRLGHEATANEADFSLTDTEEYQTSPLIPVIADAKVARHRVSESVPGRSLFLDDMRAEGITDYVAYPLVFTDGSVHAVSVTTKQQEGFSEKDLANLAAFIAPLARVAEVRALRRTATTLLDTYVGRRSGARILAGQIRRGQTDTLHAAIWLSDLRGFTALSDRLDLEVVVDLLNRYFDCQVPAIVAHGGEVLKFMGDGLLAIFPTADDGSDEQTVCLAALEAARAARTAIRALTYPTATEATNNVGFGLALHIGDVLYGNIGGSNRLDFTCIGPAVNLAARLEKLTGGLGRSILASPEFAQHCPEQWDDIGEFAVAGFARAPRVFGLRDEAVRQSRIDQRDATGMAFPRSVVWA